MNSSIHIMIQGGNKTISVNDELTLVPVVYDPDQSASAIVDFKAYNLQWSCRNEQNQSACIYKDGTKLYFYTTGTGSLFYPKQTFSLHSTYTFTFTLINQKGLNFSSSVTISVQDRTIPVTYLVLESDTPFQLLDIT